MSPVEPGALTNAMDEGFQQQTAEKVHRLLGVLRELQARRTTRDRFTLKGGTALHVLHQPTVPRLSVDIDLMVTGHPEAAPGTPERTRIVTAVEDTLRDLAYHVRRKRQTQDGAGVTLLAHYENTLGQQDNIKVDLDLLNRTTLQPPTPATGPELFHATDLTFPVVAPGELLAQKLNAVAYRAHPRDLFDMHKLLELGWHREPGAREAYLAYALLSDGEARWYRLSYPVELDVPYDPTILQDVLREGHDAPSLQEIKDTAQALTRPPDFTTPTSREEALRERIVGGDTLAFADLVAADQQARREALATHPGLAWRLSQL